MRLPRLTAMLGLSLSALLVLSARAGADAPPPKPSTPPEAGEPGKPEGPAKIKGSAPSLKDLRGVDFSAALAEARKAASASSATAEKKEMFAALLLLSGSSEEAREVLAALHPARERSDPATALAGAASALAEKVRRLPERKRGEKPGAEEVSDRLRLALAALASRQEKLAGEALAPLGPCEGSSENLRLALLALSAGAGGSREEGVKAAEHLARRLAGDTQLELRSLVLVDDVRSFGVYTERAERTCRAGENLKAYCEVYNFACRHDSDSPVAAPGGAEPELVGTSYLTALDVDLTFVEESGPAIAGRDKPPESRVILHSKGYAQVRHRTRSEIRDLHLVIRFQVPRQCAPADGKTYWLKVTARDMATGKEAVSSALQLVVGSAP